MNLAKISSCVRVNLHPRFKRERESRSTHPGKFALYIGQTDGLGGRPRFSPQISPHPAWVKWPYHMVLLERLM
jgi:hypothetical protein